MKKSVIYIISAIFFLISTYFIYQIFTSPPSNTPNTTPDTSSESEPIKPVDSQNQIKNTVSPTPSATPFIKPTPTPDPQTYACDSAGNCNSYLDPAAFGCPITFKDRYCENKCSDPSLRCRL